MKILYLDCSMGAAGDMLTAALLELLPSEDQELFLQKLNSLGIPGVRTAKIPMKKCGITGTHVTVTINGETESELQAQDHLHTHTDAAGKTQHHHVHHSLSDITHIISTLPLQDAVRSDITAVYTLIAEAESHVHGVPVTDIHFHEVGTMDALADITAVCMLLRQIHPDEIIASPVHVGSGQVQCAHGILPVPAPATAYILQGVPVYGGHIRAELCTPTGAALLKHFVSRFDELPAMVIQSVGYGMGTGDFETANCVRAILGERAGSSDTVAELSCNVDDMTAEALGYAMERLFEGGALDVYTSSIGMKKSRPGTLLQVLCRKEDREKMLTLLFRHTTTIGIRETELRRFTLERRLETVDTPCGPIQRKISSGYGVTRIKYEYEDLVRIAREENIGLDEVRERLKNC